MLRSDGDSLALEGRGGRKERVEEEEEEEGMVVRVGGRMVTEVEGMLGEKFV